MADVVRVYSGGNQKTTQVSTITPTVSTTVSVINVKIEEHQGLTHTIAATTSSNVATTVANIVTAAAAAKTGLADGWSVVTAADSTTTVTITADTSGNPFTLTASIASGPASTVTSVLTANTGPAIFSQAENFVGDTAPEDGDLVTVPATFNGSIYGETFTTIQLRGFTVEDGCPANIGSLNKPLHFDLKDSATYYNASLGGTGTNHLQIDNYNTIDILNAGAAAPATGSYGTNITGTHDADDTSGRGTVFVRAGQANSVSLGGNAGESFKTNKIVLYSGTVLVGDTVSSSTTITALPLDHENGTLEINSAITTLNIKQGTVTREGSGVVETVNVKGGTFFDNGSGTITNMLVRGNARTELASNTLGVTYNSTRLFADSNFSDPHAMVTHTSGPQLVECALPGGEGPSLALLDMGSDIRVTRGTI